MEHQSRPYVIDPSGADIHAEADRLRERGPATVVELPGGVLAWWVTDHALLKRLLTDSRVSRDTYQHWPAWENGEGELSRTWSLAMWVSDRNMITAYGAEHSRLRKLVARAFTMRRTEALRPRIAAITDELLAGVAAGPAGRPVDLRAAFAQPLPIRVITELLGLPEDLRDRLIFLVGAMLQTDATPEEAKATEHALYATLGDFIRLRRQSPGDDLTSELITTHDDEGSGLTERELMDTLLLMFTAGHETTVNLLDHAICALLEHPDQLVAVRSGAITWDDVIDEALRLEAPFASLPMRYAVEDIDIGDGLVIRRGDPIVVSFAAAGRDPAVHGPTAARFDPTRPTRREHVAFGYGVHRCLGAPLARLEALIALPALFDRFPGLTLVRPAAELPRMGSFISNGHRELTVLR